MTIAVGLGHKATKQTNKQNKITKCGSLCVIIGLKEHYKITKCGSQCVIIGLKGHYKITKCGSQCVIIVNALTLKAPRKNASENVVC